MEVSELIKKVKRLELKTKKQSSELFAGNYASTFKGRGMSFSQVRKYTFGDDIRSIDWNVTSRSLEPYIKEFEEERELTFMILVDISRSTFYGSKNVLKRDVINEIAATIAFSALKNNDKVGIIFFGDKVEKYIPPKKGKGHVLSIIRGLIESNTKNSKTDIAEALRFLQNTLKKKSVVFLLSDFIESADFEKEVKLASLRHQFYAIQLFDKSEYETPNIGIVPMYNQESSKMEWIDTGNQAFREELTKRFESNMKDTKQRFEKLGDAYVSIDIHEQYIPRLSKIFNS
jgi:uncharacterized protein (DUF58 family)